MTRPAIVCNNCENKFEHEDDLKLMKDEDGFFKGCPTCKTDGYLMNINDPR